MNYTSRIFAAAAGQDQLFANTKFANMLLDPAITNDIAVYGNTVVVAGSGGGGFSSANLCYSTDGGITWGAKSLTDPSASNEPYFFSSITVNTATGQFFVLGKSSSGSGTLLTSTNGIVWSKVDTYSSSGLGIITFFPSGPYQYVALDTVSNVRTSSDGITWTLRSALPNPGNFVTFGNGFFIVGGGLTSLYPGFLRRTADFITYTTPTINELTGGLTEANFLFTGGIYKGTTFIVSAQTLSPTNTVINGYVFKSTNIGVNFSLGNVDAAYYENVNNGMLVNTPDSRSQTAGTDTDGAVVANPNRGDALSFSGTTYSLRTRQSSFITTTTGSPSTTGLSAISSTVNVYDSVARTTTNLGLATISLRYLGGQWRISYTGSTGSSVLPNYIVSAPSFDVNVINAYVASGASITGYPFMLNNTFIVLFPNATVVTGGGNEYNSSTIYYTTDLLTWTQVASLPGVFNASSATPGFAASYNLTLLRGEYGAGGYSFILNHANNAIRRYMVGTALTAFTATIFRATPDFYSTVKGSANDGTGAGGWVGYVASNAQVSSTWRANIYLSNTFVSGPAAPSTYQLVGLDGTRVLIDNVTDVAHINSQFRVYCQFNNLLGVLSYGVLSVTTAGVVTQTINSALSNVKVLGRANSTLYVMSLTTGQVFSTTDGTTYTLRFTWNQPFIGNPVYEDTAGFAYTSGRLLTNVSGNLGVANWFTSIDGATWAKTTLTAPNSSAQSVRGVYPAKYALATSGNYVGIQTNPNTTPSGNLYVATSGSSLSNMPYKRLVTYAVPNFITSPVFYNPTLSQYCSISAYYGASATSTNGLVWSLNSGTFDVNTSAVVTGADYAFYTYAASAKLLYRFNSDSKYYAADPSTPTTYSLFSFPTIGTAYTSNRISNIAFDGTTYMVVYYNAGTLNSFTSSNGATWSAAGNGTFPNDRPAIVSGATGSFFVYRLQGSGTSAAFTSNTGSTWTSSISLNFTVAGALCEVAYGNSVYVAVGISATQGEISRSSNGTTWASTYTTSGTTGQLYSVTYTNLGSGLFIAVGRAGTGGSAILYSDATGTTWSNATINGTLTRPIYQIIDGGASASPRFVALTDTTEALTSDDGVTWTVTSISSSVTTPFSTVASNYNNFLNGRWVFGQIGILILTNG